MAASAAQKELIQHQLSKLSVNQPPWPSRAKPNVRLEENLINKLTEEKKIAQKHSEESGAEEMGRGGM